MSRAVKTLQKLLVTSGQRLPKYGVDGDMGKETRSAIDNMDVPEWVKTAMKEVGVHEINGVKNNNQVLKYHAVSGGFGTDEIPWCASFVNWVMLQNGFKTVKYPARAKSWLNFGVSSVTPVTGSIAVKSRKGGGHVCFVLGQNKDGRLLCLGGNQNDEVNIKTYNSDDFIDFRMPLADNPNDIKLARYDINTLHGAKEA